jgi:hypothetical protein
MSVGSKHRHGGQSKTYREYLAIAGDGDTARFIAETPAVSHEYDNAYGGGISVDRRTAYIDQWLYGEIMAGRCRVRGMSGTQLVQRIVTHEHTEKSVADGDNPVDTYWPCHEFAIVDEHRGVEIITGRDAEAAYEPALVPFLRRCKERFIRLGNRVRVPTDLWCEPYLEEPDAGDREVLRILRAKGVVDASKLAKSDVGYGVGREECRRCEHFGPGRGPLRLCDLVSGLVREDRWCRRWTAA